MRAQFNVRICDRIRQRIIGERRLGTTNDIIAEVAFENWFSRFSPKERANFYRAHNRKPYVMAR